MTGNISLKFGLKYFDALFNLFLQIKSLVNDNLILLQVTNNDLLIGKELVEMVKDYYKDYMRICVIAYDTAIEFYKHCGFEVSEGASPMCITTLWT